MKIITIILLIFGSFSSLAQSTLSRIIKNTSMIRLPYSTETNKNYRLKAKPISSSQLKAVIDELRSVPRTIINPKGGTAFGNLDSPYDLSSDSVDFSNVKQIRTIGVVKGKGYSLLHIELNDVSNESSYGVVIIIDKNDRVTDWMFSNGYANGGNPNGNINRNLTLKTINLIELDESSWGRNTETYGLYASYRVVFNSISKPTVSSIPKLMLLKRKFD